jgi:hypothetical protein
MSRDLPRWMFLVVILLFVVAMLIWARGPQHHHGHYVGALGGVCVDAPGCRV